MVELRSNLSCVKDKVLGIKSNIYKVTNNSTTIENVTKVKPGNIIFLSFMPSNNVYKNEFCSMYNASTIPFFTVGDFIQLLLFTSLRILTGLKRSLSIIVQSLGNLFLL